MIEVLTVLFYASVAFICAALESRGVPRVSTECPSIIVRMALQTYGSISREFFSSLLAMTCRVD